MKSIYQALTQERTDLRTEGNAILEKAERTEAEEARLAEVTQRVATLNDLIQAEENMREMLRAKETPKVLNHGRGDTEAKAVANYLRTGDVSGLQFHAAYNDTDMNIGTSADGGYAVPTGLYNQIIARRDETALFPRLGVTPIPGQGLTVRVPVDAEADLLFAAVSEAGSNLRDAPALGYKDFTLAKFGKHLDFSYELLRDEDANLMAFINNWIGRGVAATENSLLVTEALASGTAALTLDAAAAIGETEIPEFVGLLAPEYQEGAAWLMKPSTFALIQTVGGTNIMKFIPPTTINPSGKELWGYPAHLSSYVPAATTGLKSLIFGNFQFMGRRQGTGIQMLRDPYSAATTGQLRLWFWFDCVYGVLQAEAINYATQA